MIFGYARVSTHEQNLDRQLEELNKIGVDEAFQGMQHHVWVCDGYSLFLYIDGVLDDTSVAVGSFPVGQSSYTLTMGILNGHGAGNASGIGDELAIWNRALEFEEIQALYNNGIGRQYGGRSD